MPINDTFQIDVQEDILAMYPNLFDILLSDHSTGSNIIWATDNYAEIGDGYGFHDEIVPDAITGEHSDIIRPRICKELDTQTERTKDKAEVFTPSWVVNKMNNVVDNAWFGHAGAFNTQDDEDRTWSVSNKVDFDGVEDADGNARTWRDYVDEKRMEITCGEGPYLTSRYDTTTGKAIELGRRYGIIDRKLRVVSENAADSNEWVEWAKRAYQATYGFEWSGDNLLLARENMFATFIDAYKAFHGGEKAPIELIEEICDIISWNIFQMDGIKCVVPESCHDIVADAEDTLFGEYEDDVDEETNANDGGNTAGEPCPGCAKRRRDMHNGVYAVMKDWGSGEVIRVVDVLEGV